MSAKYSTFLLYPTPAAAITYTCDVQWGIGDMSNPLDEPLLPLDFHYLLAIGARLDEYEHTDDSRRRIAEVEWDRGYKALQTRLLINPAEHVNLNGMNVRGRSTLGSWFPPDTH